MLFMKKGELIKAIRLDLHLTQEAVADRLGIDAATLRKYENGPLNPSPKFLIKFARALQINPAYLMTDWDLDREDAIFQLFALFDLFHGHFSQDEKGELWIRFEDLEDLVQSWFEKYSAFFSPEGEGADAYLNWLMHFTVNERLYPASSNLRREDRLRQYARALTGLQSSFVQHSLEDPTRLRKTRGHNRTEP